MKLQFPAGSEVALVKITGNRKACEKQEVRIVFPGGHVSVTRANDGDNPDYWVHVGINHPDAGHFIPGETQSGKLCDGRLDIIGKHATDSDIGDFENPGLYHLAVRVKPNWERKK